MGQAWVCCKLSLMQHLFAPLRNSVAVNTPRSWRIAVHDYTSRRLRMYFTAFQRISSSTIIKLITITLNRNQSDVLFLVWINVYHQEMYVQHFQTINIITLTGWPEIESHVQSSTALWDSSRCIAISLKTFPTTGLNRTQAQMWVRSSTECNVYLAALRPGKYDK